MDVKIALKQIFKIPFLNELPFGKMGDGISKPHLQYMERKIKNEFTSDLIGLENELEMAKVKAGDNEEVLELILSYERYIKLLTKMNRWLGWIQAVVVSFKAGSLDEMKKLTKNLDGGF